MNTLKIKLVLLAICVVSMSFGQNSLLWEVSGPGVKKSYIFGTIHINDSRVKSFDKTFLKKLESCEMLTGEIIMDSVDMSGMMSHMSRMMLPGGVTLESLYEDENDYNKINKAIDSIMGSMGFALKMMKPFYISGALGVDMLKSEHSSGAALDEFLQNYAKQSGLTLGQLESVESQINAVDKIPLSEQAEILLMTVEDMNVEDTSSQDDGFLDVYLNQDLDSLNTYFEEMDGESEFSKHLIQNRNVEMVERILELSRKFKVFHTFGAGHLSGDKGIIALLRGKGLKVEPVSYTYNY